MPLPDGHLYTVGFEGVAITAIQDLVEFNTDATEMVEIISARLGQDNREADAQAEMLRVNWTRYATGGTGGDAATPRPHNTGTAASVITCEVNVDTTQGGTPVVVLADTFNVQAGWLYLPVPEERIWCGISEILCLELPVAPAASSTYSCSVTFMQYVI